MSRRGRRAAVALFIVMVIAVAAHLILERQRATGPFLVPGAQAARQAEARFAAVLGGDLAAPPMGLALHRVTGREELVLREGRADCRGRGIYRLRQGPATPLALVAPHAQADRHTGEIVRLLFEEGDAAAAAWNSAPRRPSEQCPGGGDPTRHATHHLTAFSLAFAATHPQGRIVQLHGFDPARRTSRAAQLADIIASDGSAAPPPSLVELADCLGARLALARVLVYPLETRELGATGNRQGRALREAGHAGFVHLELSAALRQRLLAEPELRAAMLACLAEGAA